MHREEVATCHTSQLQHNEDNVFSFVCSQRFSDHPDWTGHIDRRALETHDGTRLMVANSRRTQQSKRDAQTSECGGEWSRLDSRTYSAGTNALSRMSAQQHRMIAQQHRLCVTGTERRTYAPHISCYVVERLDCLIAACLWHIK